MHTCAHMNIPNKRVKDIYDKNIKFLKKLIKEDIKMEKILMFIHVSVELIVPKWHYYQNLYTD